MSDFSKPDPQQIAASWRAPMGWLRITSIDMHTAGEPLRVFTSGLPHLEGRTVLEKRRDFRERFDSLRASLMWEPRGHADMYGAVLSTSEDADLDVFFIHNEGYSTMCGHAILALAKLAVECKIVTGPVVTFSTPAGQITANATAQNGQVMEASFRNVPSFVLLRDIPVELPGFSSVTIDVAYGGAFYAVVPAANLGLALDVGNYSNIIAMGRRIKQAVMSRYQILHPIEPELGFLYGTIFTGPAAQAGHHSRNVCVFADGEVDRSPTGTGISARVALGIARGELELNERITVESILGSTMTVAAVEEVTYEGRNAIVPEVSGSAYFTGRHEFYIDPTDPLRGGFLLR
ncbi:MAG: proline racemase family protein [Steroidobacteraceae bacterium]